MATRPHTVTDAIIPPIVLIGVVEIGHRLGVPVESWFAGTDLDPEGLSEFDRIAVSYDQAALVLRRALRALPAGPCGMRLGRRDVLVSMGLLGVALSSCATLGDALGLGAELHVASGSLVDVEFEIVDGEVALILSQREVDPELTVFLFEEALCTALTFVRTVLGAEQAPLSVELSYPAPAYAREYIRFFRCPIDFDAHATRMRFPVALLDRRLPNHHEPTRNVAAAACRQRISMYRFETDIIAAVESLLEGHTRTPMTVTAAARHLKLTERTLRRQLAAAGESFSSVRDRVRERRATVLLRESFLPVDAIAQEVGFGNSRDFRRAYLRWTGHSPDSVRREQNSATLQVLSSPSAGWRSAG